jgi:hypothetical protein
MTSYNQTINNKNKQILNKELKYVLHVHTQEPIHAPSLTYLQTRSGFKINNTIRTPAADKFASTGIYRVSEQSGTNGNFNNFSYFYLLVKVED